MREWDKKTHILLLVCVLVFLIWSGINPKSYRTWLSETLPVIAGLIIIFKIYKKVQFTRLTYFLLALSAVIMAIGGHYTYSEVPFFNWVKDQFDFSRNHYDRFGHFFFGITITIVSREILILKSPVNKGKWLPFLAICINLSLAVIYEFIEWGAAAFSDGKMDGPFIGAQGDIWDAQWDMFLALIGGLLALFTLRKMHDKQIYEHKTK